MTTKRQLSSQAQVASIIRKELKRRGITARVRSRSFSFGNAVDVTMTDLMPGTIKEIREYCVQFEQGHFDGMTDSYEYDNIREDVPQTKYLNINVEYSDAMKQAAWDYLRSWLGYDDKPVDYREAVMHGGFDVTNRRKLGGFDVTSQVRLVLIGGLGDFWTQKARRKSDHENTSAG